QVVAKPAPPAVGGGEAARGDEPGEKSLGQILGVGRGMAAVANECVERIPVSPAEILKRIAGKCPARFVGLGDSNQTPLRGGELPRTRQRRIFHARSLSNDTE